MLMSKKKFLFILSHYIRIFKNYFYINKEVFLIKTQKKIKIIYDYSVSPCNIGDFLLLVFFIKYLVLKKKKIILEIVNKNFRKVDKRYNRRVLDRNQIFHQKIIKLIFKNKIQFRIIKNVNIQDSDEYILCKKLIKKNQGWYIFLYSLLNTLLKKEKKNIIDKLRFKLSDFKLKEVKKNFNVLHIRYDPINSPERNINLNDLKKILLSIKKKYKNINTVIISDQEGKKIFKKLDKKFKRGFVLIQKKQNIFEDFRYILSCKMFLNYKESGMSVLAFCSKIRFIIAGSEYSKTIQKERYLKFNNTKEVQWQLPYQRFYRERNNLNTFLKAIQSYKYK